MSTEVTTEAESPELVPIVLVGLLSGSIAGVAMGAILHFGANAMPFIGSLYGGATVAGGWLAHLLNSAILGVIFAYVVTRPVLRKRLTGIDDFVVTGIVYATVVGLVTVGVLLPIAIRTMGVQDLPATITGAPEGVGTMLLAASVGIAHVAYGIVLGVVFERLEMKEIPVPSEEGITEPGVLEGERE